MLGQRSGRISDSKPHQQFIESSVVFGFEVPKRECHPNLRNFKSTTRAVNLHKTALPGGSISRQS
jgi:hypothetical protein